MKKLTSLFFGLLMAQSATTNAYVLYTNQASWEAAMNTTSTFTFDDNVNSFSSHDFGDFDATLINQSGTNRPDVANGELHLQTNSHSSVLNFTFDDQIQGVGFNWRNTDGSGDDIEIIFGNTSYTFGRDRRSGWFGIVFDQPLNTFGLSDTAGDGGALSHAYIDNMQYSSQTAAVSEPSALALMGLSLLGLVGYTRRQAGK